MITKNNSNAKSEAKNNESKRTANAVARNERTAVEEAKSSTEFVNEVLKEITTATVEEVVEVTNNIETVEEQTTTATVEEVAEVIQTIETPAEEVPTVTAETIKPVEIIPLTFEELRDKAKTGYILSEKWEEVKRKSDDLNSFKLTHNRDVAKIVLSDADGKTFSSSNPKAIEKFIEFCNEQFSTALAGLENDLRANS